LPRLFRPLTGTLLRQFSVIYLSGPDDNWVFLPISCSADDAFGNHVATNDTEMFTSTAATLLSERMILKASVRSCWLHRHLRREVGWLAAVQVDDIHGVSEPKAPLTMQPMLPSRAA
jgi:hypothetical protein